MTDEERRQWVSQNTQAFLALDISKAQTIVQYRKEREAVTLPLRVREDIYVCPFVGYVKGELSGCMLHPIGSPHPQIALWPHPQNFSFYGEGICLSYDCLAKERKAYRSDFFLWAETASTLDYGRLASDHTLHRSLAALEIKGRNLPQFFSALAAYYRKYDVVTTSFEDIEKSLPQNWADLCAALAARIHLPRQAKIADALSRVSTFSHDRPPASQNRRRI